MSRYLFYYNDKIYIKLLAARNNLFTQFKLESVFLVLDSTFNL